MMKGAIVVFAFNAIAFLIFIAQEIYEITSYEAIEDIQNGPFVGRRVKRFVGPYWNKGMIGKLK